MAPSVSVLSDYQESPALQAKKNGLANNGTHYEVSENYDGDYRFAPIEEAQVSRAMIKRCVIFQLLAWTALTIAFIGTSP